tara:strand:- start:601 stop:1236 length:636 start_codon:yes stop_codon:yes gene_type:complete
MATKKAITTLDLWNEVAKTNPKYTKQVKFGARSFTTINAQYQLLEATKQFGPIGDGWGIKDEEFWTIAEGLLGYKAKLWYKKGTKECQFDINSSINVYNKRGDIDDECLKKVTTDALTKGLSKLGFNADIFLGLWDDNRYVAQVQKEFSEAEKKSTRILYTLNIGDDNWAKVLKYVSVNKALGIEGLVKNLSKKYKITKSIMSELDKVIKL